MPFLDGLTNLVANLGTGRDKASQTTYTASVITAADLAAMYASSAVAKKIVNMPAQDACREWREWNASADQISALEAEESRLGLQTKLMKAMKMARLFGGAALYIGTNDSDPSKPLDPERIGAGGITYIAPLSRDYLSAKTIQRDPRDPGFGYPMAYTMQSAGAGTVTVHPSRLVVLQGEEHLDDRFAGADLGWGDSVLTACLTNVRDLDATMANIASLVFEAKVDVVKIPNFMASLRDGGPEYEKQVLKRTTLAHTAKGINGTLLLDSEEEYSQKTASFATLPDVADRFMLMTSAASGIPVSLLFGRSAAGLNATGESDVRGYYDRIKADQATGLQPAMSVLDECLIRSALGNRPDDIFYNWRPLWQPTTKERAETGKIMTDSIKTLHDADLLPGEVLAKTAVNALTESGAFPGLEGYADEYGDLDDPDDDEAGMMQAEGITET